MPKPARTRPHRVEDRGNPRPVVVPTDTETHVDHAPVGWTLQRYLAACGFGSRRACEALVTSGRVQVNGEVITRLGARANPETDTVTVDGAVCELPKHFTVVLLHKPAGYACTCSDPHAEQTVLSLVKGIQAALKPVGRLDVDTTGALLLTDDGELAYRLTHPRFGVEKVYLAEVRGTVEGDQLKRMTKGVELADGPARARRARVAGAVANSGRTLVRVWMTEGRKHEVKRLFKAVGLTVTRLHRESFAGLSADKLKEGRYRRLSAQEIEALRALTRKPDAPRDAADASHGAQGSFPAE